MAAITNVPVSRIDLSTSRLRTIGIQVLVAGLVWFLARQQLIAPALLTVAVAELWPYRRRLTRARLLALASPLVLGASTVMIIVLLPKAISQLVVAAAYGLWRVWRSQSSEHVLHAPPHLLMVQLVAFEALFLLAAIREVPRPLVLGLAWAMAYITVYQVLAARGERMAGILAAAWALVVAEAAWIFLTWLISYITPGTYAIVPQPTLILGALAYCFGNIYAAQRQGQLNRARLTEYLLIGLILIWIVIAGTAWRGTV